MQSHGFPKKVQALLLVIGWYLASPAYAYVDMAPTLARVISDSKQIALIEVADFIPANHRVVLKPLRTLKGEAVAPPIEHQVATTNSSAIPRHILQWAKPGATGVLFLARRTALVCIGQGWYQVRASDTGKWTLGADRPDLPLAYYGTVSRLAEGIEKMLAGKDAVLTVVAFGADNEGASFDLALNRFSLPGLVRVQRIRANLKMPPMVMGASSSPAYFIGVGPVAEDDLPELLAKLKASDAMSRAEAADDLRYLGRKAIAATTPLTELLKDSSPSVRFSAASALLRISPPNADALNVLAQGLAASEPAIRRNAAKATGLSGAAATSLVSQLPPLLRDTDEAVRITALQAISMLGPAAAEATPAVIPLLDDPNLIIDAADTLGHIGSAARPALKQLTPMLSAEEPAIRWAAVRAMAQIGGEEARPAVEFIINNLPNASEVEGYNMMIYLSLLGAVAKDAIPTIQSIRIKNPVLPSATLWAIECDKSFPWLRSGRGGFGMPGPGGGNGGGPGDIALFIYEAYVHELGDRLRPAARVLASQIMEGTAGNVPTWGYKILACAPDETIEILAPYLTDSNLTRRERAAVALGYMGPEAISARKQVESAMQRATSEREKRLMQWCLREITANESTTPLK